MRLKQIEIQYYIRNCSVIIIRQKRENTMWLKGEKKCLVIWNNISINPNYGWYLGMAIFPCPSPLRPSWVFLASQRWWGRDGARFYPRTTRQGGDEFRLFRLALPSPAPPDPRPTPPRVAKGYICKFFIPKTLLFKQTYQY